VPLGRSECQHCALCGFGRLRAECRHDLCLPIQLSAISSRQLLLLLVHHVSTDAISHLDPISKRYLSQRCHLEQPQFPLPSSSTHILKWQTRHTIIDPPSSELADLAPKTEAPLATLATGVDNNAFLPVNLAKSEAFFLAEVVKNFDGAAKRDDEARRTGVDRRETARDMVIRVGFR
jgi:hypothetical protein